jgi:hypothetical protein
MKLVILAGIFECSAAKGRFFSDEGNLMMKSFRQKVSLEGQEGLLLRKTDIRGRVEGN